MRQFNYKCTVSKNGTKMYYKRVNKKWQRISNKVGMKAEKGKRKYSVYISNPIDLKYRINISDLNFVKQEEKLGGIEDVHNLGILKKLADEIFEKLEDELKNFRQKNEEFLNKEDYNLYHTDRYKPKYEDRELNKEYKRLRNLYNEFS